MDVEHISLHGCVSNMSSGAEDTSRVAAGVLDHWKQLYTSMHNWIQFSLVAQSCPTPCDSMGCSTPGFLDGRAGAWPLLGGTASQPSSGQQCV